MPKFAAHEAENDEQVQQWHDEAYAEYEKALAAYTKATDRKKPSGLMDNKVKRDYEEARDNLVAGTQYWRQVGEEVGTRTGIFIQDNVIDGEEE